MSHITSEAFFSSCLSAPALAGLDPTGDQVLHALGLARSLLSAADTFSLGARKQKLMLTVGIHTGPAQGVLVGQSHPVLHFAGQLPAEVHMLQATCPVNCVHVSAKVVEAVGECAGEARGGCAQGRVWVGATVGARKGVERGRVAGED